MKTLAAYLFVTSFLWLCTTESLCSQTIHNEDSIATGKSKLFIGGLLAVGISRVVENSEIPVKMNYTSNVSCGGNIVYVYPNQFFVKIGIDYSALKTPFLDDVSYVDAFLQAYFLLPGLDIESNLLKSHRITFTMGPQFSLLMSQGTATMTDKYYKFDSNHFGDFLKLGVLCEVAAYRWFDNRMQSFGFRLMSDIPGTVLKFNVHSSAVPHRYLGGSIFYNFNFQTSYRNR